VAGRMHARAIIDLRRPFRVSFQKFSGGRSENSGVHPLQTLLNIR
jgi:hypothetical protein